VPVQLFTSWHADKSVIGPWWQDVFGHCRRVQSPKYLSRNLYSWPDAGWWWVRLIDWMRSSFVRVGSYWRPMITFKRSLHVVCVVWPDSTTGRIMCDHVSDHCSSEFGHYVDSPVKGVTAILALRAIKGDGGQPFERLSTLGMCCPCVFLVWEPSNSLVLARVGSDCEWVILVRLHCEIASSGTRCSSCKPVMLVTLGDCHLLDGLVASSLSWSTQEDCAVL
jgi:hypothetical protein